MNKQILFRIDNTNEDEYKIACEYFHTMDRRNLCRNSIVIPRYSCLPFYQELEDDLGSNNCHLINSYQQHKLIASFEWYNKIWLPNGEMLGGKYTPKTWFSLKDAYDSGYEGPFFIKGETNSRKYEWNTHCFATNKKEAVEVASRLGQDGLIGGQRLIFREFVKLNVLETGLNGIPFSNEWRFFFVKEKSIAHGYYWSSAEPETIEKAKINKKGLDFATKMGKVFGRHLNFYVLDIAEKDDGEWILIECNDGGMSGLSEIPTDSFYKNLKKEVDNVF